MLPTYLQVGTLAEDHTVGTTHIVILLLIRMWLDAHIVPRAAIVLGGKRRIVSYDKDYFSLVQPT